MNYLTDRSVGVEVTLVVEGNLPVGTGAQLYLEGAPVTLPVSFASLGPTGPSTAKFTPTSSGLYTLVLVDGSVVANVDVVSRTLQSYLRNVEDEALGSWVWNRVDGTLQMLRQDGSLLANFAAIDTQTESSRERIL